MGMSISSVANSTGTSATSGASAWQQRAQNFNALSQALQSNNLSAAQSAYSALTANASSQIAANPNSPLAQLGQALQSGNLASANQAFGAMTAMARHGGHHHGGGEGGGGGFGVSGSSSSASVSPPTATTGNNVNLVA